MAGSVAAATGAAIAGPFGLAAALAGRGASVTGAVLLSMSARPGEDLLRWQARQIGPTLPAPVRARMEQLIATLTEQIAALDEWLTNGGFPPDAWLTDDAVRVVDPHLLAP